MNPVSVENWENSDRLTRLGRPARCRQVETYSLALVIRVNAFDFNVAQFRCHGGATRIVKHRGQRGTTLELIDGGPLYRAIDRNLRPRWGHQQRVAGLHAILALHAMQQEVVQIDFPYQLLATIMP